MHTVSMGRGTFGFYSWRGRSTSWEQAQAMSLSGGRCTRSRAGAGVGIHRPCTLFLPGLFFIAAGRECSGSRHRARCCVAAVWGVTRMLLWLALHGTPDIFGWCMRCCLSSDQGGVSIRPGSKRTGSDPGAEELALRRAPSGH